VCRRTGDDRDLVVAFIDVARREAADWQRARPGGR
jgi:hypothetical protein